MKQIVRPLLVPAIAVLAIAAQAAPASAACLSGAEVRDAVTSGQILSAPEIYARAGVGPRTEREVLSTAVCDGPGGLVYELVVFDRRSGSRQELTVSAR